MAVLESPRSPNAGPRNAGSNDNDKESGGSGFGRKRTRQWQRFVVSVLARAGSALQRMPRDKALRWGERIGSLAYHLGKRQREYARRNLRVAQFPHPGATNAERDALIRRVFVQFAKSAVDFLRGPALTDTRLSELVRVEGWEHLETAIAGGRGVIIVTAHFGNWEMLGRYVAARGAKLTVVAREPEDPAFGDFVRSLRRSAGFDVKDKGSAARDILSALKKGEVVGILPDQNSGDLFAPFFGLPAGTVAGPASFALRTGAPIIPGYMIRLPDETYLARFHPPLSAQSTGERGADIQRIMTEANHILEQMVREYPDQWLWLHNRWKSAFEKKNRSRAWPEGEQSPQFREAWARWKNLPDSKTG